MLGWDRKKLSLVMPIGDFRDKYFHPILSLMLDFYTCVILPMLHYPGCHERSVRSMVVLEMGTHAHGRQMPSMLSESDVIMCYSISAYSISSESLFKIKSLCGARKIINYMCEGVIEKSIPLDQRLSSLRKPRDARR